MCQLVSGLDTFGTRISNILILLIIHFFSEGHEGLVNLSVTLLIRQAFIFLPIQRHIGHIDLIVLFPKD